MSNYQFEIKSWDEKPYYKGKEGGRLSRASITKLYTGDLEGTGELEYLMAYNPEGSACFVGIELVQAKINNRYGSFVLRHEGTFEKGVARSSFNVVDGSAIADLQGLAGSGSYNTGNATTVPFDFKHNMGS